MISTTGNRILMTQAREALRGKWGLAIASFIVFFLVLVGVKIIPFAGRILSLLFSGPMSLGWAIFALSLARNGRPRLESLFEGFQNFGTALAVYLLIIIFVLLWSLLLIISGIIAVLAYSQTFYLLADNRTLGPPEVIRKSKEMMLGNKGKFFCMCLRFVGWALLSILTFGIGFLWLFPYFSVTMAKFYDDLRNGMSASGLETENFAPTGP